MSQPTSGSADGANDVYIDRKQARHRRKRPEKKVTEHFGKHKFKGPKYMLDRAPLLMPIDPETPPVVVAMWTYLCVTSLTIGWFACSLFGYHLCRMWRNVPATGEGANLEFIFTVQPLNRWAVNLVVSFGMLLFFTSQSLLFVWRRAVLNRARQKKAADDQEWVEPKPKEEPGEKKPPELGTGEEKKRREAEEKDKEKIRVEAEEKDKERKRKEADRAAAAATNPLGSLEVAIGSKTSKDNPKSSTHVGSASQPPPVPNDPPGGHRTKTTTDPTRTPADEAGLRSDHRRRKTQPCPIPGSDEGESARAAEKGSSKPASTATDPLASLQEQATRLAKEAQKPSLDKSGEQSLPPSSTLAQPPITSTRNEPVNQQSTSSDKPNPSETPSNDNGQAPHPAKSSKNTTTPPPLVSSPEANPKHPPKPDKSTDSPSDPIQKPAKPNNQPTTSQIPAPNPTSITSQETTQTNPTIPDDTRLNTPNHRTMEPIKPILKRSGS